MPNPFFTTNMPLPGKRTEGKREEVRVIRREDVSPKALHSKFSPDPNAKPEQTRVLMSSDLRAVAEAKRFREVSAQKKRAEAQAKVEAAAKGAKPRKAKSAAAKPQREARAAR